MKPKRIILLLDGTWNDADVGSQDTNIVRLGWIIAKSLEPSSRFVDRSKPATAMARGETIVAGGTYPGSPFEHIVLYERGVGTGPFETVRGGAFGGGLDGNIRRAYKFLSYHYRPGDQVFIFGFSRGAYTARSLAGFIGAAGLLRQDRCTAELERTAWEYYRTPPNERLPGVWVELGYHVHDRKEFRIDCVGVFDTVGALGVPLGVFWRLNRRRYQFHNVELSSIASLNLHALAVDEHRHPFQAAVWRKHRYKTLASVTEQVWFPGAHADVGGSYVDETRRSDAVKALDDLALDWMLKRVKHFYSDFPFEPARAWKLVDDAWARAQAHQARGHIYRLWPAARRAIANRAAQRRLWRYERAVCHDCHADPIGEMVHISVLQRLGSRARLDRLKRRYRPWNLLAVLQDIEDTYKLPPAQRAHPDILIVDWSGEPIAPDGRGRARALEIIGEAKRRLGLAPSAAGPD